MATASPKKGMAKILNLTGLDGEDPELPDDTKMVVVGNKGSGKSSFIECFVTEECVCPEFNEPRLWRKTVGLGGPKDLINFVLRELPASDNLIHLREQAYKNAKAVVICYSVTDRESWEAIEKWADEARRFVPEAKLFVVGHKMEQRKNESPVSRKEGKDMARKIGAKYYEISAYTGKYVHDLVLSIEDKMRALVKK